MLPAWYRNTKSLTSRNSVTVKLPKTMQTLQSLFKFNTTQLSSFFTMQNLLQLITVVINAKSAESNHENYSLQVGLSIQTGNVRNFTAQSHFSTLVTASLFHG